MKMQNYLLKYSHFSRKFDIGYNDNLVDKKT